MLRLRNLMLALVMAAVAPAAADASLIFSMYESAPGFVTLDYSGFVNTTGLFSAGTLPTNAEMQPNNGNIFNATSATLYFINASGSSAFGSGGLVSAASSSGDPIFSNFGGPSIIGLPAGYASGAPINGTMTFTGTLASLGVNAAPWSTTYTWGGGGAGRTVTLNITAIPEPATLGILAIGSVVSGYTYRRRAKRNAFQSIPK